VRSSWREDTAIRSGKIAVHKAFMIAAFCVFIGFFGFVLGVSLPGRTCGVSGQAGFVAVFRFTAHALRFSRVIVPMILVTLRRAWLEDLTGIGLLRRWTLRCGFYVSVTG